MVLDTDFVVYLRLNLGKLLSFSDINFPNNAHYIRGLHRNEYNFHKGRHFVLLVTIFLLSTKVFGAEWVVNKPSKMPSRLSVGA